MTWVSGATGRELTRPKALLVAHLFNHQTHHRGQVHALLTGFGIKPGITDLPFGENIYAG
nr:DinB family protein [Hyphomicrobium facile]